MFVTIYIKSKNLNSLKKFLQFFFNVCKYENLKTIFVTNQFNKKKVIKTFTVLQSPHINKKSGEKFEYSIYCKQISLYSFDTKKILILIKNISSNIFPDVTVKVHFLVSQYKIQKLKKEIFNPDNFLIKKKLNTKYIKIFDIFGEACF